MDLAREPVDPFVVEHDRDEDGVRTRVDQRAVVVAATAAQPDAEAVDGERRDDDGVGGCPMAVGPSRGPTGWDSPNRPASSSPV